MSTTGHPGASNDRGVRDRTTDSDGDSVANAGDQLGKELAERLAPFDQLAHESGTEYSFTDS